jgi:predicted RNase H-like nuclease
MRVALGIDAAWTSKNPSGLALVAQHTNGWKLIATAASYQNFYALTDNRLVCDIRPSGSLPNVTALLETAALLCKHPVDIVAIDMPLARTAIVGRRNSDNEVSRAYGSRKCSTHSPSALRPGRISDDLKHGFEQAGYPLCTGTFIPTCIIEVYPHPALVELSGASERLPYKVNKTGKYWPHLTPSERRASLLKQWRDIITMLEREIMGVSAVFTELELASSGVDMKAYEDILDAIICAWVGVCVLEGRARQFGDEISAIWVPNCAAVEIF